jgi:putative cell wall-binding protein
MIHSRHGTLHKGLALALCFVLVASIGMVSAMRADALTYVPPEFTRHAGADRYETAVLASQKAYPDPSKVDSVIVAIGDNFPDALAGAPLAAQLNAPVLLTKTDNPLNPAALREVLRLHPAHVYILGDEAVISDLAETTLKSLCSDVVRIGGADRYQTATLVAEALAKASNAAPTEAFLVTGTVFADALSVGAIAAQLEVPILLTNPNSLSAATSEYLKTTGIKNVTIIGSVNAVSAAVETELKAAGVTTVNRYGGTDRYDTARLVVDYAAKTRNLWPANLAVASGDNFPDAVVAAASLGARDGIVLLSKPGFLSSYIPAYINACSIAGHGPILSVEIFGSTVALSEWVESALLGQFGILQTGQSHKNNSFK